MAKQDAPSVRINRDDYERLKVIKAKSGVPIVRLIQYAVPVLEREFVKKR